jgi:rod shape-determining protein MreD
MMDYNYRDVLFFLFTIMIAMILITLPLPRWLQLLQPSWVLLVILFWFCVAPEMIGLGWFWCIGLFQDMLVTTPLGMYAIVYLVVGFLLSRMSSRLSQYPLWQQLVVVSVATVFQIICVFIVMNMAHQSISLWVLLPSIVVNCLIWRLLFLTLHGVWRRRLRLY